MRSKNPHQFKRYLTEPQELPSEWRARYLHLNLRDLKQQVGAMDNLTDIFTPSMPARPTLQPQNISKLLPLQSKIQNKRNALKKLPQLVATPHFNNGQDHPRTLQNPSLFKANNPLYVVNTLLQIMKEDISIHDAKNKRELEAHRPESSAAEVKGLLGNEFSSSAGKSVKVYRPPRILDNELNRLTHQTTLSRRKIKTQEKSRPKMIDKDAQLLTFYRPRPQGQRKGQDDVNQFL